MSETATTAPAEEPKDNNTQDSNGQEVTKSPSNNFANEELNLQHLTLNQLNFIGKQMAASEMFTDLKGASSAIVKILAGQEIGVTPFQAMTNIHIIQGKATMGANMMAAKVKGSGKYDYLVKINTPQEVSIDFYQDLPGQGRTFIGNSSFTLAEAKAAGTKNLDKFPRNMLFARAMSNGTKWYAPDVFNGNLVYTPDEMGGNVNMDGEFIDGEVAEDKPAPQPPKKAPAKAEPPKEEIVVDDDMSDEAIEQGLDEAFDDEKDTSGKASKEQISEVKAKFKAKGFDTYEAKSAFCKEHIGKNMPSTAMDYNKLMVALDEVK